jgi:hypothetical protein
MVDRLSCYLPMRLVLIGKPHVHHERISTVGAFNPLGTDSGFSFTEAKAMAASVCYFRLRTRASLRPSAVNAMQAPITRRPSIALKLPGATQLMQVPMIVGTSPSRTPPLDCPQSARVNPLCSALESSEGLAKGK